METAFSGKADIHVNIQVLEAKPHTCHMFPKITALQFLAHSTWQIGKLNKVCIHTSSAAFRAS